MAGLARVRTRSGAEHERYVATAKGEPENPMSQAELRAKFDGLAAPYLDADTREAIASAVLGLEAVTDIHALLARTRPRAGAALRAAGAGDD